ncbi:MAG: shikimate dehydrogenase [Clostridiales bacterium]|nr:shikimate dehydrogenase [Clostridiales bacterium]
MIVIDNYILIGNPVKHSISPLIHNTFFKDMEYNNKKYDIFLVEKLDKNIIHSFFDKNIKGINVTVPYKIDIMKYLYKIDEQAKRIGSINTLKYTEDGYIGYNTDIDGMEDTLLENNINIKNKIVLIIGAGGSGYTASFMALKNKVKKIVIANRTIENSIKLKDHILKYYKDAIIDIVSLDKINSIENIEIIINTTTLGFGGNIDKSPLNDSFFKNNNIEFVFDIIYTPFKTKLLQIAENNNIKCTNGFAMLIYQALKAEEIWQDKNIDILYKINLKNRILLEYINRTY